MPRRPKWSIRSRGSWRTSKRPTDSRSPISLLEMGLYARSGKLFVACSPDYYRYDNVRITCRRYGVPLYDSLTALLDDLPQQSDE